MRVSFSGKEHINANITDSENFFSDTEMVSKCIPDSRDFSKIGDNEFSIAVEVGIGNLRGTFLIHGLFEKEGNGLIKYLLTGGGFGNKVSIQLVVRMDGDAAATNLSWNADFDVSGIISGLGQGIVRGVSEEKISEIISNIKAVLEKNKQG